MSKLTKFEWLTLCDAVAVWEAQHEDDERYTYQERLKLARRQAALNRVLDKTRPR